MGSSLVNITPNLADLAKIKAMLDPAKFRQGLFVAVRNTTDAGKRIASDAAVEQTGIIKKHADRAITSKTDGTNPESPVGIITISHQAAPLIAFKPSVTKQGVYAKLGASGGTIYRHGFEATVKAKSKSGEISEHDGIFIRKRGGRGISKKGRAMQTAKGIAWRLPIKQLYGPPVINTLDLPAVAEAVEQGIAGRLHKEIESQIARFTKGQG